MRADSAIPDPAYQDALHWLYGLSPNIRTAAQIVADHPRKLARTRALLDLLGGPDRQLASVLVAGTKGKGSVAAYTESMLRAAGYAVGMVSSPHLTSWCERTRIDGQDVEPSTVARLMPAIREAVDRLGHERPDLGQATTFEAGFAFALLAFVAAGVQIAVVEAGVGGLHDATNVLDPLAVALTPVSYDHMATLGPTLTHITREKTGVFRAGRLAASARQPAEAQAVIDRAAEASGARLEMVGQEWQWHPEDGGAGCGTFVVAGPRGTFRRLQTPLLGRHQRENAALAVALVTDIPRQPDAPRPLGAGASAGPRAASPGLPALASAVRSGLASVRWPGRLQVLRSSPWLVLDGAHNGDSARRLAEAVSECFPSERRRLVFGTSVGKDVTRMLDALLPIMDGVTLTRSHHERSVPLDELARIVAARGVEARIIPEVRDAIGETLAEAGPRDLVLVTGSLFVVGEALEEDERGRAPVRGSPTTEAATEVVEGGA
ncbi:MAG: bifunctional folylpolyglutamate synthase/dihydrofolate synthase [Chloroflexi bacterium]|nr:bifunctional folylpolyglutamate synthase/dihydrofolate synthase [Chloroflexota bacterium]